MAKITCRLAEASHRICIFYLCGEIVWLAQQRVEAEKGEGEAKLARSVKEALANQKLAGSLTPLLVQQAMIDKLSAEIQVPAGGGK